MGGILGWLGSARPREQADEALASMVSAAAADAPAALQAMHGDGCVVATLRQIIPASLHRDESLLAAVQGRISFRRPELESVAAQEGDGAALARAYRLHGSGCLESIGGEFAIAVVDWREREALIAVDRMGVQRLSYAAAPGQLVFAFSAEAVASHPQVGRRLSRQGLFNYLYMHAVPSPGTIYEGVGKLQPGECVRFRGGRLERSFYWTMRYRDGAASELRALKPRFRNLLREAVGSAVAEREDVGAFLSGGTDSSTLTGVLTELRGRPARTYSIGFRAAGFDEMDFARITARHFGAAAREYYVTPEDVVDAVPTIARAYDEPFGNASAVPTFCCARLAREDGVGLMLAGDGGDELFGGNARYAWQKLFEVYSAVPAALRRGLIEPAAFGIPGIGRLMAARKLRSYIEQARVPLPDRLDAYNFLRRAPLGDLFEPEFLADVDPGEPLRMQRDAYQRSNATSAVDRMMHLDLKFTLADNDLRKVSRMCHLAGVEVRYPLLDDALVAFSGEIPAALKVRGLRLRHFFKEALKDFLPPETLAKAKHGFGLPFGIWMKEHAGLAALARESLSAFERRGIVRPAYLRQLLREHASVHASYYGVMVWVIMMLEQWLAARRL